MHCDGRENKVVKAYFKVMKIQWFVELKAPKSE
jgi:hypothetical protein